VQDTDIPPKFPVPWANSAGGSFIRAIPTASQIGIVPGEPSLTDGWVPLNALPVAGGGIPPDIRDQNGILNAITKWQQWEQAGGAIPYDATFQTAIGGYPKNAIIGSAVTAGLFWLATTDNNVTNPDTGGAGWLRWPLTRNGEVVAADVAAGVAVANLGFPPVQQGTGVSQTANVIKIGWSSLAKLLLTVDATNEGQIVLLRDFTQSLAPNGWVLEPNGLMLQWGTLSPPLPVDNFAHTYNFPNSFPNSCGAVVPVSGAFSPLAGGMIGAQASSVSQFSVTAASAVAGGSLGVWFIAIGY
jgi:hypothetical protein